MGSLSPAVRRNSFPFELVNECAINKVIKGDWDLNQYWDISSPTKEFDFNRNDSGKEIDDEVFRKLLACENCPDPDPQFTKELRKLTQSYRIVMEEMSAKLDQWLEMRQTTIHNLQKTSQKFSLLKKTTTGITLASSTLEFAVCLGTLMQRLFHFDMNSKYSVLMQVVSGLSMTVSFSALMYSNNSVEDIIRELRNEKYLLRDIETVFRRANWIDKELQELFPHGIDLKLVTKLAFDTDGNLVEKWEEVVYSAILSTNVQKDEKLKSDRKFLASVKAFVRSTAAQIWINRMKLRSLLDYMAQKIDTLPNKKSINGSEVFLNLAAINLYPLFFSLFYDSKKLQELKLLWNSLSAISTALSLKDTGGFEDMEATSTELQKDYKHVKKLTQNLLADYD